MDEVAIRVEGLGKRFRLQHTGGSVRYRTLREDILGLPRRFLAGLRGRRDEREEFWALKEVSFEVKRGEVLGIIGRNGAGKSTLLKILSRIIDPTCGEAMVQGRIGSLLEVGTGFHPELTGRENIFLSGALLGMRREEVRRRFDEIVAFAGVEKFLDTSCKHYSSGMYARLGFAVAAHLDTEILLIDEVLAVGDSEFKLRCSTKVRQLAQGGGKAIILVTHEPALIRNLCTRVLLMSEGALVFSGNPSQGLAQYHDNRIRDGVDIRATITRIAAGFYIDDVRVAGSVSRQLVLPADCPYLDIEIKGRMSISAKIALEVRLCDREGNTLGLCSPGHDIGGVPLREPGPFALSRRIHLPRLLRGRYLLGLYITDPHYTGWVDIPDAVQVDVEGATTRLGIISSGSHCGWILLNSEEIPRSLSIKDAS
jgi:lipopolysaccharide transport system ATP-binding protein